MIGHDALKKPLDRLLEDMDEYAIAVHPEYGLPLLEEEDRQALRKLIIHWLIRHRRRVMELLENDHEKTAHIHDLPQSTARPSQATHLYALDEEPCPALADRAD